MGTALSGSVGPSLCPCKEQTWLVCCTWDIVPETVDTHGCPRDVTEHKLEALWGNGEGALPHSLRTDLSP